MAAQTAFGRLDEFKQDATSSWNVYIERAEFYFAANKIVDEKIKRDILLSAVGPDTFSLLRSVMLPDALKDCDYKALTDAAMKHFHPDPSEIVERYNFRKRTRKPAESVADFVRDLRRLSEHCNFGANLEEQLRDQVVYGINNDRIQQKMLDTRKLTLKAAVDLAQSYESATEGVKSLQSKGDTAIAVNLVTQQKQASNSKWKGKQQTASAGKPCYRCLGNHAHDKCPFKTAECYACKKKGHVIKACKQKKREQAGNQSENKGKPAAPRPTGKPIDKQETVYTMYHVLSLDDNSVKLTKTVVINGKQLEMEVDTGASHTLVSLKTANWLYSGKPPITPTSIVLRTYTGEILQLAGQMVVKVKVKDKSWDLVVLVVRNDGPSLLGKTWLHIKEFWPTVHNLSPVSAETLVNKYPEVFRDELGTISGPPVKIALRPDARPKFLKARPVPLARRDAVDTELDRMIQLGILEPVTHSEWASPVVIAPRKDGRVRLCGDYRETVNANAEPVSYPLPRAEELFANLSGGKTFTVFDLSDAYLQQPVDDESSMLLTINTHRGLFRVLRLPFGVSTAPAIFQRKMESMLKPIPNTNPLLDDVITTGQSDEEHVERVEQILELFRANNVRLNRRKFQFMVPDVAYLGHRISQEGIQPLQEKLEAIQNAPNPENVTQLRAFLGLLSYYRRFVPHLATLLEPLHRLTDDNVPWAWTGVHSQAFEESKQHLTSSAVLVHYDLNKPVVLACDASQYGVGAVLSHIMDDNSEKPIAYASRTMSKTERKYAQIDKEALSIIFGVRKFHQYLAGRSFVIMTDHQPLLRLFAPHKRMPEIMSPRMLRWSLLLAGYNYTLQFRAGKHHANADALSRLPIPADVAEDNVPEPPEVLFVNQDEQLPVTAEQIAEWTTSDNTLKQVLEWVKNGWPITKKLEVCFEPYVRRKDALTCLRDCLLWGSRVIVPPPARPMLLQQLHESHMGMNAMEGQGTKYFLVASNGQ